MDHLWKLCAAAGFRCIPIQAETIAIAILEGERMIASQANGNNQRDNANPRWLFQLMEVLGACSDALQQAQLAVSSQVFPQFLKQRVTELAFPLTSRGSSNAGAAMTNYRSRLRRPWLT